MLLYDDFKGDLRDFWRKGDFSVYDKSGEIENCSGFHILCLDTTGEIVIDGGSPTGGRTNFYPDFRIKLDAIPDLIDALTYFISGPIIQADIINRHRLITQEDRDDWDTDLDRPPTT
jgi:hypothetical protein